MTTHSVDEALALAAQLWADGKVQLSPWGITQAALSLINKEHALHVRSWNVEKDGDYAEALARAIRSCLEGYAMDAEHGPTPAQSESGNDPLTPR